MSNNQDDGRGFKMKVEEADTDGNAAHAGRGYRMVEEADTEGNMPRIKLVAPAGEDGEDTDGNASSNRRVGAVEEADTESDTEGNRFHGI